MVKSYQPHIDVTKLIPGVRVQFWRSIYVHGVVTIASRDKRTWKLSNEWYQTKEGIRVCSDEITHVFEETA